MTNELGRIFIVSTPIGNLSDITFRAIEILKYVDVIFCEDTRTSQVFLNKYNIVSKLEALHKFNELSREDYIRKLLLDGKEVAIISDAGTPLISDPGQFIISKLKNDFEILSVPGPSAIIAALSTSGLVFESFSFLGFIPKEENKIVKILEENINNDVIIFYESPKRIKASLKFIMQYVGDIKINIARELTKKFEENENLLISEWLEKDIRGEIVILIPTSEFSLELEKKIIIKKAKILLEKNVDKKTISSILETKRIKKNEIYKDLLSK